MIGIYKITNKINGKCYIGQSTNIEERLKAHKRSKQNKPLYNAFKKYNINNFIFEVLEECKKDELSEREIYYIDLYKSSNSKYGYNLSLGGEGHKELVSERTRKKISKSKKGKLNPMYGVVQSKESKKQQSESFKKTISNMPKEKLKKWHDKIGKKHKGKIVSQEQREKISNTLKEYFKDEEHRKRLSEQRKGISMSLSTRIKLSIIQQEKMKEYSKKVLQYDLKDNLIAEYDSLQEASKQTGSCKSGIGNCCNGKAYTCNGFKWKYDEEFNKQFRKSTKRIIKPKQPLKGQPSEVPKRWKKVYQYDECYNLIKVFDSFKQVAEEFGEYKNVSAVCRGQREHAYGYRWSYTLINKENNNED